MFLRIGIRVLIVAGGCNHVGGRVVKSYLKMDRTVHILLVVQKECFDPSVVVVTYSALDP